ncbi:hypothetical protein NP493_16g00044 [Ridgeia piscesae]|uniref:Kringle domain-containing protein n=1 Tax=Ridgeia piscesae TaxID=27915 RepID=A0AAD9UL20_RIDPI|nr:hypothetical protein NP493_16g00044 [Ridgeia piscesae]
MCKRKQIPEIPNNLPAAVELFFTIQQSILGSNCLLTKDGQEFVGAVSFTETGRRCQYWSSHTIHHHWECPGEAVNDNYCTNSFVGKPGCFKSRPWCYTTDPKVRWEYCNIHMCTRGITGKVRECLLTPNGTEYRGHMSVTKSGRKCQKWSSHKPHKHMFCFGEAAAENFCSNSFVAKCESAC